jgi:Zn ribbon nucleic-acid-binding protein
MKFYLCPKCNAPTMSLWRVGNNEYYEFFCHTCHHYVRMDMKDVEQMVAEKLGIKEKIE